MKRTIFLISLFTMSILSLTAQDLIITNEGRQIECKIIEMNEDVVKYSPKLDGTSGRSKFMILRSEVTDVKFGVVEQVPEPKLEPEQPQTNAESQIDRIYRDNGEFRYKGVYVSRKEVESILRKNPEAAKQLNSKQGLAVGGLVMSCSGLVLICTSFAFLGNVGTVAGLCAAGGALNLVAIGMEIGSLAKFNKAIDIYNSRHDDAAMRLNLFVSPSEIGFALAF
ncbi:MAG: hypothetical protein II827_01265 [Paludibacteraceae bacterium]|nr:hypothetical protein [Paludibacteraceae bacterium]